MYISLDLYKDSLLFVQTCLPSIYVCILDLPLFMISPHSKLETDQTFESRVIGIFV